MDDLRLPDTPVVEPVPKVTRILPVAAQGWLPVTIVVAIGLGITLIAFLTALRADQAREQKVVELRVEWRIKDIQAKVTQAREAMVVTALHIADQPRIDAADFHRFTSQVVVDNRSIVMIGWAQPVTREQRTAFESSAGRSITVDAADGQRVTAPERDDYTPLLMENRFDDRQSSVGFDLSADPARRLAMETATNTGFPQTITAPHGASAAGPVSVTFRPIFDAGSTAGTQAERRAHLRGYVVGVFNIVEVLNDAIANTPKITEAINFYLSDKTDGRAVDSSFRPVASLSPPDDIVRPAHDVVSAPAAEYEFARSFDLGGQQWRLESFFSHEAVGAEQSLGPLSILVAGLLMTAMTAAYTARGILQVAVVRRLVDRATAELRQSNGKLEALIEASPSAIVCLGPSQLVIIWNAAAENLFGYKADEVLGRHCPLVLPEQREEFYNKCNRLVAGQVLRNLASHRRHRDGTVMDTRSSATTFHDTAGKKLGVIFIIEDLRERSRVQNQLVQAQKMEAIGQLTGGLAHDFNNLIGIVLGNLDLLADRFELGSEERNLTRAGIDAALRGAELTRQLLAFSRRQPLAPKLTYLPPVLEATAQLLRRTLGEDITVSLRLTDTIWPVLIDLSQLESTLLNLAVNARDAMPNGGRLIIEAQNSEIDARGFDDLNLDAMPGDYILISVSDTGTGMSPEVLAHVYEPFFTTKGTGGTGLGLSMVHGFLKQSGGYTKIYSELGRGTTIRLYLPRAVEGKVFETEGPAEEILPLGKELILVVEDNNGMRELAMRYLMSLGYRTIPADDAASALEIIRGGARIDLLFTDVVMPGGMDGRALADAAVRERPGLKVLFTSGFTAAAASAAIEDEFGSNLLSKPYRKGDLARRIRAALDAPA